MRWKINIGIELELIMSTFNSQIEAIKKRVNSIKSARIEVKTDSKELEYLTYQIKQMEAKVNRLKSIPITSPKFNYEEILKAEASLEKLQQKYEKIVDVEKEVEIQGNSSFNSLSKGIEKVTSKIKRYVLSLFSIRSAYALISKASSAYLSQNTELANKLQAVYVGLGSLLEPIISKIANLMIKAVKYINIFIKALTGVDLLAKATAKSLAKTTSSSKALSKALGGFDELTNLDTTSDSSSSGLDTSWVDAFNDVEVDDNIAKTIENIAEKIKSGWQWIKDNWKAVALGVVGVAGAFLLFKLIPTKSIGEIGTSFTGLLNGIGKAVEAIAILGGLSLAINEITGLITAFSESGLSLSDVAILLGAVLGELTVAFVAIAGATKLMDWQGIAGATVILAGFSLIINQVSKLLKIFRETGMTVGDVALLMATVFGTLIVLMGAIALLGPAMTAGLIPFAVVVAGISALLIVMAETIPTILDACSKFINNTAPSIKSILETIGKLITGIIYALGTTLPPIINSIGNLFDKVFNGISKVISTIGNTITSILNTVKSLVTTVLSSILNFINQLGPSINNFVDNAIKAVTKLINFMISGIEYLVNNLVIPAMQTMVRAVNLIPGVDIELPSKKTFPRFVPSYDVGTNYVPEDQLAYIHKGEAVIPKKFNSQEYFGNSNEETNSLLEQVIDAINNIEVNPYTTIKDVGKTAVNYINSRNRQLGGSVIN